MLSDHELTLILFIVQICGNAIVLVLNTPDSHCRNCGLFPWQDM